MGQGSVKSKEACGRADIGKIIDHVLLTVLGVACLQYVQFYGKLFAQAHIKFAGLEFPIFVGEFLLAGCLVLLLLRFYVSPIVWNNWHVLVVIYVVFVVVKALLGFSQWGALAFRDAAMFYYPVFAIVGYFCYRSEYFNRWIIFLCYSILLFTCFMKNFNDFWVSVRFFLGLVLTLRFPNRKVAFVMAVAILLVFPYKLLLDTARMLILGNFIGAVFFIVCCSFLFEKKRRLMAFFTGFIVIILLASYVFYFSGYRPAQNIFNIPKLIEEFKERDRNIKEKLTDFKMNQSQELQLYNPDVNDIDEEGQPVVRDIALRITETVLPQPSGIEKGDDKLGNSVFRLVIWRDLAKELWNAKPLLGFDFGKPFRSISVESTRMALTEWTRDGWIAIHNSYLNMIYRAGVVGIGLIAVVVFVFVRMSGIFIRTKNIGGLLLCSGLVVVLVASFFGVILELPYTAIPIWCLFGMTFSMAHHTQKALLEKPRSS